MANHVQSFTATGTTSPVVVRCHRAGFVSEEVTLNPTMTVAQIKAAFEALTMFTTVTPSAAFNAGNGTSNLTFANPANERLWFELMAPSNNWTSAVQTAGQSLAEAVGVPIVDEITYNTARFNAVPGGKPAGVNSANLRIRSKNPGDLDTAYSAWSNAITGVPWAGSAVFNIPSYKIIQYEFEVL